MNMRSALSILMAGLLLHATGCTGTQDPSEEADVAPPVISAVDATDIYHVRITYDEDVTRLTAENADHYELEVLEGLAAPPGGLIDLTSVVLERNNQSAVLSTWQTMSGLKLRLNVHGVSDVHGNELIAPVHASFTGSNLADNVAPAIVRRFPTVDAADVAVPGYVMMQFSEPVNESSLYDIEWTSEGWMVPIEKSVDGATLILRPIWDVPYAERQTIRVIGIKDAVGNRAGEITWSFTTATRRDMVPPELVSSSPAHLANNVSTRTNFSLTFSEPIDQFRFYVSLAPQAGPLSRAWSNGGRTVTIDAAEPLLDNQQYVINLIADRVFDLSGNPLSGFHDVVFSTGSSFETGRIDGTVSGHPGTAAENPTGSFVFAETDSAGYSTAAAGSGGDYSLLHLADARYFVVAVLDTDANGRYSPWDGDAFGAYGGKYGEPVTITGGGSVSGIDFPLHDPSAIDGTVVYTGDLFGCYSVRVGMFTSGEPGMDNPVAMEHVSWYCSPDWHINSYDQDVPPGEYEMRAYLDANRNQLYDAGIDPYGTADGSIVIGAGVDYFNVVIKLRDPVGGTGSIAWREPGGSAAFRSLCRSIERRQTASDATLGAPATPR